MQRHKAWTPEALGYFRTFTASPYARELCSIAGLESTFLQVLPGWQASVPRFEQRANSVTELLRASGIKQILEIGAGYSDRGLVMTEDPRVEYVESDLKPWIERKKQAVATLLQRRGDARQNLRFAEANARKGEELVAAAASLSGPVAVISEGLLSYQYPHKRYQIALNIRHLLQIKDGIWITPDLMTRSERDESYLPAAREFEGRAGCSSRHCFEDEEERDDFIRDLGFTMERWYQSHLSTDLTSIEKVTLTDVERREIAKTLDGMRVYRLTPINASGFGGTDRVRDSLEHR